MNTNQLPFNGNISSAIEMVNYYQDQAVKSRKLALENENLMGTAGTFQAGTIANKVLSAGASMEAKALQWQAVIEKIASMQLEAAGIVPVQNVKIQIVSPIQKEKTKTTTAKVKTTPIAKMEVVKTPAIVEDEVETTPTETKEIVETTVELAPEETPIEKVEENVETAKSKKEEKPVDPILQIKIPKAVMSKITELNATKGGGNVIEGEVTPEDYKEVDKGNIVIEKRDKIVDGVVETITVDVPKMENGKPVLDEEGKPVIETVTSNVSVYIKRHTSHKEKARKMLLDYLTVKGIKTADWSIRTANEYLHAFIKDFQLTDKAEKAIIAKDTYEAFKLDTSRTNQVMTGEEIATKCKNLFGTDGFNFSVLAGVKAEKLVSSKDLIKYKAIQLAATGRFKEAVNVINLFYSDQKMGFKLEHAEMFVRDLMKNNPYAELEQRVVELLTYSKEKHGDHTKEIGNAIALVRAFTRTPKLDAESNQVKEGSTPVYTYWENSKITKFVNKCIEGLIHTEVLDSKTTLLPTNYDAKQATKEVKETQTPPSTVETAKIKPVKANIAKTEETKAEETTPSTVDTSVPPVAKEKEQVKETTGQPVLKLVYKSNSAKTVFDCEPVEGSQFGPKLRLKANGKKSIGDVAIDSFKAYMKNALKNSKLGIPTGFEKYKIGEPFTLEFVEKQKLAS